jgi:hypothetical protein
MSIVQTAETISAYDIKIAELKKAANKARMESLNQRFRAAYTAFSMVALGLCSLVFLIVGLMDQEIRVTGLVLFLISSGFTWLIYILLRKHRIARDAAVRKYVEATASLEDMQRRKDAIVTGVVAVTNKDMEAVRQAANTIEAPVNATLGEKTCPMCAETIKAAAKKCKHCGHLFEQQA